MNEKWEYGGSYVSYPIKPAVPYTIDENIIMVHDWIYTIKVDTFYAILFLYLYTLF